MAFGEEDARGIYQYGEDDAEATFSELLNKGMQSVSDATKYFSGTPAERAAMSPAPEGARWKDTGDPGKTWLGVGGNWVEEPPGAFAFGNSPMLGAVAAAARLRVIGGSLVLTLDASGYGTIDLPAGTFPNALISCMFQNGDLSASSALLYSRPPTDKNALLLTARTIGGGVATGTLRVNYIAMGC